MSEIKRTRITSYKKQTNIQKNEINSSKLQSKAKMNSKNRIRSSATKQEIPSYKISQKLNKNVNKVNEKIENKDILQNDVNLKKHHSQNEFSSGLIDSKSNKDENEFEQQIQNIQNDLTPADPNFVKSKYKDMLTQYEMAEIDEYPEVYFIGNSIKKKITQGSFDDEGTFHYIANIGDHLAYRYEIISILGKGANSTVVKCIDHKTNEKVAIKILVNTPFMHKQGMIEIENMKSLNFNNLTTEIQQRHLLASTNTKSSKIQSSRSYYKETSRLNLDNNRSLNTTESSNSNMKHVIKMLDSFIFRNHICIVTEILGESLHDFILRRTKSIPSRLHEDQNADEPQNNQVQHLEPLPTQMVKLIAYQIMDALASIHRKKIIHGNLNPENIVFTNPSSDETSGKKKNESNGIENLNINNLRKDSNLFSVPIQPLQKITSYFTMSFSAIDRFTLMSQIKIIGFSSSCRSGKLVFNDLQSCLYRAPEIVMGSSYDSGIDIWSAGCIIAELFVGKPIFQASNDIELLACFIETLGTPPQSVVQMQANCQSESLSNTKSKTSYSRNMFFSDNGRLLNISKQPVPLRTRLTSFLKSSDTMMIDFLSKCLEWDKNKRLSAAKLCKHPWIADFAKQKI